MDTMEVTESVTGIVVTGEENSTAPQSYDNTDFPFTLILIINMIVNSSGLIANIIVLAVFMFTPISNRFKYSLIINLSVASCILILSVTPMLIPIHLNHGRWMYGQGACQVQGFLISVSILSMYFTSALIAFNRYISVVHMRNYHRIFQKIYVYPIMIATSWIYPFLITLPALTGWSRLSFHFKQGLCCLDWTYNDSYTLFAIITGSGIPIAAITYFYLHIFWVFYKSRKTLTSHKGRESVSPRFKKTGTRKMRTLEPRDVQMALKMLLVVLMTILSFAPLMIVVISVDRDEKLDNYIYDLVEMPFAIYCIVNPCVYFYIVKPMRKQVCRLCKCCKFMKTWNVTGFTNKETSDSVL